MSGMKCASSFVLGLSILVLTGCSSKPTTKQGAPVKPPEGFKSEDVKEGTGREVERGDYVTVNYTGTLTDGKVFDTSKKPGRDPFEFLVGAGRVIKGWDYGLLGMKKGGVRKLTIPAVWAYGETGSPPTIPPNATLIFEIELLKIEEKR